MNLERKLVRKKYSTNMASFLSVLPSVTEFGKAALLPNNQLTYNEGTEVLIDGKKRMVYPIEMRFSSNEMQML